MIQHHLLLVDGDTAALEAQTRFLRSQGFLVTSTSNADDALESLSTGPLPVVAIVATFLPGSLDGFGLCAALKSKSSLSNIRCIFLCDRLLGEHSEGRQAKIRQALKDLEISLEDYLPRSVSNATLVERIMHHITTSGRSQLESALLAGVTNVGRLEFMGSEEIALFFERNSLSGKVIFHTPGDDHPQMFFRNGQLIDARFGKFVEDKAFFAILTINEGSFEVIFGEPGRPALITTPIQTLILEGQKQASEVRWIKSQLPPLNTVLHFNIEVLSERLGNIPDAENRLLKLFDGKTSLQTVLNKTDFEELAALRAIQNYFFDGLLIDSRAMTPPTIQRLNTDHPLASPVPAAFVEEATPAPATTESPAALDSMLRAMADISGTQTEQVERSIPGDDDATPIPPKTIGTVAKNEFEETKAHEAFFKLKNLTPDEADALPKEDSGEFFSVAIPSDDDDSDEIKEDDFFSEGAPLLGEELATQLKLPKDDTTTGEEPSEGVEANKAEVAAVSSSDGHVSSDDGQMPWTAPTEGLEFSGHVSGRTPNRNSLRPTLAADQEILGNDAETPVPCRHASSGRGAKIAVHAEAEATNDEVSAVEENKVEEVAEQKVEVSVVPEVKTGSSAPDAPVLDVVFFDDPSALQGAILFSEELPTSSPTVRFHESFVPPAGVSTGGAASDPHVIDILNGICDDDADDEDTSDETGEEDDEAMAEKLKALSDLFDSAAEELGLATIESIASQPEEGTAEAVEEVEIVSSEGKLEPEANEDEAASEDADEDEEAFFTPAPASTSKPPETAVEPESKQSPEPELEATPEEATPSGNESEDEEDDGEDEDFFSQPPTKVAQETQSSNGPVSAPVQASKADGQMTMGMAEEEGTPTEKGAPTPLAEEIPANTLREAEQVRENVLGGFKLTDEDERRKTVVDSSNADRFARRRRTRFLAIISLGVLMGVMAGMAIFFLKPREVVSLLSQGKEAISQAPALDVTLSNSAKPPASAIPSSSAVSANQPSVEVPAEPEVPVAPAVEPAEKVAVEAPKSEVPQKPEAGMVASVSDSEKSRPVLPSVEKAEPVAKVGVAKASDEARVIQQPAVTAKTIDETTPVKEVAPKKVEVVAQVPEQHAPSAPTTLGDEGEGPVLKTPVKPVSTKLDDDGASVPVPSKLDDDGPSIFSAPPKKATPARLDDDEEAPSDGENQAAQEEAERQAALNRGDKLLESEEYPKAARVFEDALKKWPNDQRAISGLGRSVVETNPRRAIKLLTQAVALDPTDKLAWYDLGVANQFVEPERTEDAIRAYEKFLTLAPKSKNPNAAETRELVKSMKEDLRQKGKLAD